MREPQPTGWVEGSAFKNTHQGRNIRMEGKRMVRRENKRDKDDEQKVRKVYTKCTYVLLFMYSLICS